MHRLNTGAGGPPAVRHAVGLQCIDVRQAKLQRVEPEHVRHDAIELLLLPTHEVAALRRLEEVMQTYNLDAHGPESASLDGYELPNAVD